MHFASYQSLLTESSEDAAAETSQKGGVQEALRAYSEFRLSMKKMEVARSNSNELVISAHLSLSRYALRASLRLWYSLMWTAASSLAN